MDAAVKGGNVDMVRCLRTWGGLTFEDDHAHTAIRHNRLSLLREVSLVRLRYPSDISSLLATAAKYDRPKIITWLLNLAEDMRECEEDSSHRLCLYGAISAAIQSGSLRCLTKLFSTYDRLEYSFHRHDWNVLLREAAAAPRNKRQVLEIIYDHGNCDRLVVEEILDTIVDFSEDVELKAWAESQLQQL
jgi:hypothetical protein